MDVMRWTGTHIFCQNDNKCENPEHVPHPMHAVQLNLSKWCKAFLFQSGHSIVGLLPLKLVESEYINVEDSRHVNLIIWILHVTGT